MEQEQQYLQKLRTHANNENFVKAFEKRYQEPSNNKTICDNPEHDNRIVACITFVFDIVIPLLCISKDIRDNNGKTLSSPEDFSDEKQTDDIYDSYEETYEKLLSLDEKRIRANIKKYFHQNKKYNSVLESVIGSDACIQQFKKVMNELSEKDEKSVKDFQKAIYLEISINDMYNRYFVEPISQLHSFLNNPIGDINPVDTTTLKYEAEKILNLLVGEKKSSEFIQFLNSIVPSSCSNLQENVVINLIQYLWKGVDNLLKYANPTIVEEGIVKEVIEKGRKNEKYSFIWEIIDRLKKTDTEGFEGSEVDEDRQRIEGNASNAEKKELTCSNNDDKFEEKDVWKEVGKMLHNIPSEKFMNLRDHLTNGEDAIFKIGTDGAIKPIKHAFFYIGAVVYAITDVEEGIQQSLNILFHKDNASSYHPSAMGLYKKRFKDDCLEKGNHRKIEVLIQAFKDSKIPIPKELQNIDKG